jgi:hypothetical protein
VTAGWRDVVERFGMAADPEGGWYVETWRATPLDAGGRPIASAILFLLPAREESRWHRVDADELWQFSAGDPLELRIAPADGGGPIEGIAWARTSRPVTRLRSWSRRAPGRRRGRLGVDAGRLHRGAGLLIRWVRARARRLGAARVTISERVWSQTTLLRQSLLERTFPGRDRNGHASGAGLRACFPLCLAQSELLSAMTVPGIIDAGKSHHRGESVSARARAAQLRSCFRASPMASRTR